MKILITFCLVLFSFSTFSQCTHCNSFAEALKNPKKVKSLKINPWQHNIRMTELPKTVGQFVNAKVIRLTGHHFDSTPKSISSLQKLEELSLAECNLKELPDEIFQLKKLKEIILFSNSFSEAYKTKLVARFKKEMPKTKVLID